LVLCDDPSCTLAVTRSKLSASTRRTPGNQLLVMLTENYSRRLCYFRSIRGSDAQAHYLAWIRIACRAAALLPARLPSRSFFHSEAVASASRENRARRCVSSLFSACAASRVPSLMNFEAGYLRLLCLGADHSILCVHHAVPRASLTDLNRSETLAALRMTSATCSNTLSTWCWSMFLIHRINHHVAGSLSHPIGKIVSVSPDASSRSSWFWTCA
jgi:hypothetical protein